ncbi:MAG: ABC transporter substrate-binding protein [Acidimicrobiales bacterium]
MAGLRGSALRGSARCRLRAAVVGVVGASLLLAACSNASAKASSGGKGAPGVTAHSITVGSLATATGPLSQGFGEIVDGVKAYFDMVNAEGGVYGRKLHLAYEEDDAGNPTTDADEARTLVEQDHVFAVVGVGTPFFSGSQYLAQTGTPTFGYVVSSNWDTAPSLFGTYGSYLDFTTAQYTVVYAARQLHATSVAVVAYGVPASYSACEASAQGLRRAGIDVAFTDFNFGLGANPVPDVLQMASHHVDLFITCMERSDNLAFARAMHQYGLGSAHAMWFNGYSRSMVADNPALTNGVIFLDEHVPFEAVTSFPGKYPAMQLYIREMRKYEPRWTYDDVSFQGWVNAAQFVAGLRAAGPDLTQKKLVSAINSESAFTAGGLMPPVNWHVAHTSSHPPYCSAFVEAENGRYVPILVHGHGQVFTCVNDKFESQSPPPGTPGA